MNSKFYAWWVTILLMGTGVFWTYYFGLLTQIYQNDITYITSLIAVIFVAMTSMVGYYTYKLSDAYFPREKISKFVNDAWFVSEQLMALGMFGTVIGLIHMLSVNFHDLMDSNNSINAIGTMFGGLGVALYTNAVGLVTSIILKFQTHYLLGKAVEDSKEESNET